MSTRETNTTEPVFEKLAARLFLVASVATTLAWIIVLVWLAGYEIGVW
jgi:hypothetical protein